MDTTEQLSGKYYFDGMSVDKEELLMWLILDEFTYIITNNVIHRYRLITGEKD
ncbi:hypothetical protein NB724_002024 [Pantoea ananatis]|nr:hypothetical protein [Pantoea ananatis]MBN6032970.1 hypothetical protein [Pantoea ananatis]MCW0316873.1 hypothetical protein [Pantoea ananatis]MCW0334926.1 hypothetical protein [Pantoea ananatis]MCW0383536.1 hypothetical protein [Pantoea ananatis]MCW0408102.1 hypothetical protein [Pantoea ananatis]